MKTDIEIFGSSRIVVEAAPASSNHRPNDLIKKTVGRDLSRQAG
jgi:hypothetical protein